MAIEAFHVFDNLPHVVTGVGLVYLSDILWIDSVKLQDVVVDTHQGVVHLWTMNHGGVGEYADLGLRTVAVAQ